ncbi:MAG: NADH-quinone oxidoreductase subunit A [Vampirovibrionales bacterium]|nr:NADH-quinone oxidoreductase subunit A [Vampirovibrionales bacterium]
MTPLADPVVSTHFHLTGFPLLFALLAFAAALPFALLALAQVVMFKAPSRLKETTYESGMDPFGDARLRFDLKFYLFALLFILFDIETVFLFPWAMALGALGPVSLLTMGIFIGILLIGLAYAWKKDALRWQ